MRVSRDASDRPSVCILEEHVAGLWQSPGQAFRHVAIPDNE